MGNILFRTSKKSKVTDQDRAVLQLKTTRDKIKQFQKRSEATLDKDREMAKKLLREKKKERAKLLLRRKKFIEEKLKQADGQLEGIEKMIQDLEYSQIEIQVVDVLKIGNAALKQANDLMSIEDIEQIMDETAEAIEKQKEIDDLLSGGLLTADDEAEVENELELMIEKELKLPDVPAPTENIDVVLPDVPQNETSTKEKVAVLAP